MNNREKEYCKYVGKAIRKLRENNINKSGRLFAYENDIPKATISRVEIGDANVRLITLKKIADGFGYSMSELFKEIEKNIPNNFKINDEDNY